MARRRYKPSIGAICKIGTLAHNRSFTAAELRQYSGHNWGGPSLITWLKKHGHIMRVGDGRGKLYPTKKGWKMIDKACGRRKP